MKASPPMRTLLPCLCLAALTAVTCLGATVDFGDILVTDSGLKAVIKIDRKTGDRILISGMGLGTGMTFQEPSAIAVSPTGAIIVADAQRDVLFQIDPATGNRQTLVQANFINVYGLLIDRIGRIYTCDIGTNQVLRFDADGSGRTTMILNGLESPQGMTFDAAEANIWIADTYEGTNTTSYLKRAQNQPYPIAFPSVVSGGGSGNGPAIGSLSGVARMGDGIYVTDLLNNRVTQVNTTNGNRTTFASGLSSPRDIKYNPARDELLVLARAGSNSFAVYDVGSSGAVSAVPWSGVGPAFSVPTEVAVFPIYLSPPPLRITADARSLIWPAMGTDGWRLETNTTLEGTWTPVTSGIAIQASEKRYTVAHTSEKRFFRLRR